MPWPARFRRAGQALRDRSVLRWLILLQVSDLLLDAFTGFVAVYLVAVAGVSPAQAALAVGVRLAADLAGTALLIPVLDRVPGRVLLRASAAAALALYPAFLLVPGFWPKVVILAGLSGVTAAWYPVLQAQLYASLPGQSGTAVSLLSAAGLAGGLGPLTVGFVAGALRAGLGAGPANRRPRRPAGRVGSPAPAPGIDPHGGPGLCCDACRRRDQARSDDQAGRGRRARRSLIPSRRQPRV